MANSEVRIDKWMWAVRIFKTRTISTDACKKGRVSVNNVIVKPSRTIKVGDVVDVRKPPVTYSFKVIGLIENRVGAHRKPGGTAVPDCRARADRRAVPGSAGSLRPGSAALQLTSISGIQLPQQRRLRAGHVPPVRECAPRTRG